MNSLVIPAIMRKRGGSRYPPSRIAIFSGDDRAKEEESGHGART